MVGGERIGDARHGEVVGILKRVMERLSFREAMLRALADSYDRSGKMTVRDVNLARASEVKAIRDWIDEELQRSGG